MSPCIVSERRLFLVRDAFCPLNIDQSLSSAQQAELAPYFVGGWRACVLESPPRPVGPLASQLHL